MAENEKKPELKKRTGIPNWLQLSFVVGAMTIASLIVSVVMGVTVNEREYIGLEMDQTTSYNYGGEFIQQGPSLNSITKGGVAWDMVMEEYSVSGQELASLVSSYVENTNLVSTDGNVLVTVDLQKRGLRYEPTFRTEFNAEYVLSNTTDEETYIEFEFPFPSNVLNKEINNAKLVVNGEEVEKPIKSVPTYYDNYEYEYDFDEYDYYVPNQNDYEKTSLYWEGKIPANSEIVVQVSYNTVGLSRISYQGIENPDNSQDFNFEIKILGSRKYDNEGSLSIDEREYITEDGKNGIILKWSKPELFSSPEVQVSIATLTNPSRHLNEMYKIMTPLYLFFSIALIIMAGVLNKRINAVDMILLSILFIVFFPLLHYIVSFNIDPSADLLSNVEREINFSMPLYGAFGISLALVGGLMLYLTSKTTGKKFAVGIMLPLLVMSMGFFPLAMTLPEYKYLLVLLGVVLVLAIAVQVRVKKQVS